MEARSDIIRRKRVGVAGMTILAVVAGLVGYAGAQAGPSSDCAGETTTFGSAYFGTEDQGNRLISSGPKTRDYPLTSPLAAGTYDVNAVSYDGYTSRELIEPQLFEQWFAELLAADGTVLAATGQTVDIADGVTEASWSGSIGQVTIDQEATSVRVVHGAFDHPASNSVRPVCIGAELVDDEPVIAGPVGSSVEVDYENVDNVASPVGLDCGNNRVDGATGRIVELVLTNLEPDASCRVTFTDGSDDCDLSVTDNAAWTSFDDVDLMVGVPLDGRVDIVVDISCAAVVAATTVPQTATTTPSAPTTTAAPTVVPTPTTQAPEIEPEVKAVTEVATPIDMNPAFTG